jgi:predicted metal-binding protein
VKILVKQELEKDFNIFIEKWCGTNYAHLIDTDENDGEIFREKLRNAINNQ